MARSAEAPPRYGRDQLEGALMALETRAGEASGDALQAVLRSVGVAPTAAAAAVRDWARVERADDDEAEARRREGLAHAVLVGVAVGAYIAGGQYDEAAEINRSGGARVRRRDHHSPHAETQVR